MKLYLSVKKPNDIELDALSGMYSDLADALTVAQKIGLSACLKYCKRERPAEKVFSGQSFSVNLYLLEDMAGQTWKFLAPDPPPCLVARLIIV